MFTVIWQTEKALKHLRALADRLRDLRPAWGQVLSYMRLSTARQFASEGAHKQTPWTPLNPQYAARKSRKYPGMPILRASDEMFESLIDFGSRNSIAEIELQSLTYGTRDPKARFHKTGTARMPARPFVLVTAQDRRAVKGIVRRHLENQASLSGFGGGL